MKRVLKVYTYGRTDEYDGDNHSVVVDEAGYLKIYPKPTVDNECEALYAYGEWSSYKFVSVDVE